METKSKKKLRTKTKSFSLKKSSSVRLFKGKSPKNLQHQLMIPQSFLLSIQSPLPESPKGKTIIFRGDSGHYQNDTWVFQDEDTNYLLNPINYEIVPIYPHYQRLYWTGKSFINLNQQLVSNIPSWFSNLLPEENRLDLFLERSSNNDDWSQAKLHLLDLVSSTLLLSARQDKLNFIVENSQLQWKITNIPDKHIDFSHLECPVRLLSFDSVANIRQAYYVYKENLWKGASHVLMRKPDSLYETGMSFNLLEWKSPESKTIITTDKS